MEPPLLYLIVHFFIKHSSSSLPEDDDVFFSVGFLDRPKSSIYTKIHHNPTTLNIILTTCTLRIILRDKRKEGNNS